MDDDDNDEPKIIIKKKKVVKKKIIIKKKIKEEEVTKKNQEKKERKKIIDADINVETYENQLTDLELVALKIAREHLESSFNMNKSIGYLEWVEKNS